MKRNNLSIFVGIAICLFFIYNLEKAYGQNINFNFKQLSTKDGLSSNEVRAVFEDSNGFIWFATSDGLNRWDGNKFDIFKNYNNDLFSLPSNFLLCLAEDKSRNIWIGTNHDGLIRYNSDEEKFYSYLMIQGDEKTIPGLVVRYILVDTNNEVWIGTHSGLAKYIPGSNSFKRILLPADNLKTAPDIRQITQLDKSEIIIQSDLGFFKIRLANQLPEKFNIKIQNLNKNILYQNNPVCFDSKGFLWIGTKEGLIKLNLKTGQNKRYQPNQNIKNSINSNNYSTIFEDSKKNIWIGTENRGVNLYNSETDNFTSFTAGSITRNSISNNIISNIYEDKNANIWFSTLEGGVSYFSYKNNQFEYYFHDPLDANSLSNNKIGAFHEDKEGNVWIGTEDGGLNKFLTKEKKFIRYHLNSQYIAPCILNIEDQSSNSLYITGLRIGLYNFNKQTGKFSNLMGNLQNDKFQSILHITDLGLDSRGNLWLTTHQKEGVMVYEPKSGQYFNAETPGPFNKELLSVPYAVTMLEDSKKRTWIVSYLGLFMFDSILHTYLSSNNVPNSLSSNYLYTIYEDAKNNIWIGNSKGLDLIIETGNNLAFERYSEKYPLPNCVKGILEDNSGNLWLSSNRGITKFNPVTKKNRNFNFYNELKSQELSERVCYKTTNGEMYFGGTNGFIKFNPNNVDELAQQSPVFITDFQLFNKSQKVNKNSVLKKSILYTKEIELNYNQSVFSFEYSALDYNKEGATEYAYILEGFDDKWNFVGEKRFATYTNLSPGNYTFRVTSAEGTQLSNAKGTSVRIIINPPIWRTSYAYLFYLILLATVIYLFRRSIIYREKLKNEILFEKNEIKNVRESNIMKLRFFTNISHEFRTPLTLIKAPIEKLIIYFGKLNPEEQKNLYTLIQNNTDKLLRMINQLLDYRKLEAGSLVLEPSEGDIVDFCRKTWSIFCLMAEQKKINYIFKTTINSQIMKFDADKIDKIITNLLSNALKFTSEGGEVSLFMGKNEQGIDKKPCVEITIKDTGIGIPENEVAQIFERFYTVSRNGFKKYEGTGIGLTLVKELTELHNGKISLKSKEFEGSEFKVLIPINFDEIKSLTIDQNKKQEINEENIFYSEDDINKIIDGKPLKGKHLREKYKILIVEDDDELRSFLYCELAENFDVIQAKDGEDGLRKAFLKNPDLIVSDVMMPHMDGIELCKTIKSDERTSHLPVVLLTARHSQEKQIEGLDSGADDYILKPFNSLVLKARIINLLNIRTELQQKFKNGTTLSFDSESSNNSDRKLIQSIIDIVHENISNEKINADFISKKLFISRSLIYIKIEALTGQSVNEFIRNIRLKKATSLLHQKNCNITEVAFSVGFGSQSYFTRCFTKKFGKSPKDYASENQK